MIIFLFFSFSGWTIEVGSKVRNIQLPSWENKTNFELAKVLKKKKVVLNFWASWCTACINELNELEELKKKYSPGYEFYGINAGEKPVKIKKFLRRYKFSYHILLDKNQGLAKELGIEELPRTLVIDNDSKILFSSSRPPKSLE